MNLRYPTMLAGNRARTESSAEPADGDGHRDRSVLQQQDPDGNAPRLAERV
ncbi:MAG TPA: hypothetical protein VMB03_06860 [Bryobacteraceae bacterium]|nr:hypothetical protein [Bryobacteraceae bacterium]